MRKLVRRILERVLEQCWELSIGSVRTFDMAWKLRNKLCPMIDGGMSGLTFEHKQIVGKDVVGRV